MSKEQLELIKDLAEIIALIAKDPECYSCEYIRDRYLWDLGSKEYDTEDTNAN